MRLPPKNTDADGTPTTFPIWVRAVALLLVVALVGFAVAAVL